MNLSKSGVKVLSVLIGWFFINCLFYYNCYKYGPGSPEVFFWPLDNNSFLAFHYDFLEFMVYAVMPLSMFIIYIFIIKLNKN